MFRPLVLAAAIVLALTGPAMAAPGLVEAGIALADQGKLEAARKTLEQAVAAAPDDAAALNGLGYVYYKQERFDTAIGLYRRALATKDDPQFHLNLGLAFLGQSRWGQAEDEFRVAVAGNPGDYWSYNNLGYALQLQGRADDAIEAYQSAIALAATDVTAHGNLGSLLAGSQAWTEAVWVYRDALKHDDAVAGAHVGLANALAQLGRHDEALMELRVAERIEMPAPATRHLMAELYRHRQELEAAEIAAFAAVAADPADPAFRLTLGQILVDRGRFDDATRAFQAYLRLAPTGEEANQVRAWLSRRREHP